MLQKAIMPNESVLPEVRAKKANQPQPVTKDMTTVQPKQESIQNNNNNVTQGKPEDDVGQGWKRLFFGEGILGKLVQDKLEPQKIPGEEK